jgi:hypothetical protein
MDNLGKFLNFLPHDEEILTLRRSEQNLKTSKNSQELQAPPKITTHPN